MAKIDDLMKAVNEWPACSLGGTGAKATECGDVEIQDHTHDDRPATIKREHLQTFVDWIADVYDVRAIPKESITV